MGWSRWGKWHFAGLGINLRESAPRFIDPLSFPGPLLDPEAAPCRIATTRRGSARSRPRALRYSGTWAPRSRTTPGALRTTMRRTSGRIGHEARPWSQRPGRIASGDYSPWPRGERTTPYVSVWSVEGPTTSFP